MSSNSESEAQSLETAIHRINTSNYDDALTICRNLIAANPEDCPVIAKAHLIAGHAYLLLGQLELSEQELRAGLQLDPSLAQGYIDLGFIFSKRKLHAEAISYYKRAKESSLVKGTSRLSLASGLLYERQYEDAYAEFEKLVLLTDHNLSRSGLQIWRGIAWWKKLRFLYRLLISGVLVLFVMLPVTRVVAWLLISLLTLIALFILQRARWLRETGGPIVFPYAVLTGLFLLSVWHPWR